MVAKGKKFHATLPLHSRNQLGHLLLRGSSTGLTIHAAILLYIRVQEGLTSAYQTALYQ